MRASRFLSLRNTRAGPPAAGLSNTIASAMPSSMSTLPAWQKDGFFGATEGDQAGSASRPMSSLGVSAMPSATSEALTIPCLALSAASRMPHACSSCCGCLPTGKFFGGGTLMRWEGEAVVSFGGTLSRPLGGEDELDGDAPRLSSRDGSTRVVLLKMARLVWRLKTASAIPILTASSVIWPPAASPSAMIEWMVSPTIEISVSSSLFPSRHSLSSSACSS
mmetsp:Transcript_44335/g.139698  ORF Transcript_44335/g.139698 Transcript_44335/m.139698 type:complete len:221 (-) Transcript_44335:574-1236(-)